MEAPGSPESEALSIECFQNYTAPEVFVQGLAGQIDQQDVEAIIRAQKQMLQRFEKTNEMLSNCNRVAASRFLLAQKELKKHTTVLTDMKKDMDNVFKRIRNIKAKLATQYPAILSEISKDEIQNDDEDCLSSHSDSQSSSNLPTASSEPPLVVKRKQTEKLSVNERAKSENLENLQKNFADHRLSGSGIPES